MPIIKSSIHEEIRNSYYGGVVEVFKNHGKNLFHYDVNSLYPFSMLNLMPTGNPTYSTDSELNNYFGIVFVEVNANSISSTYANYPLLPHRIDGRMYNPLGTWRGWYFSEEVKLAVKYGYGIKVLYGYKFDKTENVFKDFVNKFYSIKSGTSATTMDRTTAKLLLNSLYGRLGMNPQLDIAKVVSSEEAVNISSKFQVKEQYSLTNKLEFIRYTNQPIQGFEQLYGSEELINFNLSNDSKIKSVEQSLPCAIAITAYSRMFLFETIYKMVDLGATIYYADTDSLVINNELPEELVGLDIGQFKLENKIKEGYFIAPKLYAIETFDNGKIVKAKSIGSNLKYFEFKALLAGKSVTSLQERWYHDKISSSMQAKTTEITINPLILKRNPVIVNGKLYKTTPLNVNNFTIT